MKNNFSLFQIILLTMSILLAIGGLIIFAFFGGLGKSSTGPVIIWGTMDIQAMQGVLDVLRTSEKSLSTVSYVQKDADSYHNELVDAIARGNPPDLFMMTQEDIETMSDKTQLIPYTSMSQSTFVSAFVDEGQLFLKPNGILALPFAIDPMLMFWNRDIFAASGLASPPTYWGDLVTDAPIITKSDVSGTITQSTIALGLWTNVDHSKEIVSLLLMQAGDKITTQKNGILSAALGKSTTDSSSGTLPAESAMRFYTDFVNPSKTVYSWNRSFPGSRDVFLAGKSAIYLGFSGEYKNILAGNPNLHVGVAVIPQVKGRGYSMTYGRMYSLAIPRGALNPVGAVMVAGALSGVSGATAVSEHLGLPSGRRDLGIDSSANAVQQVIMNSALIARGWIDPEPALTSNILQTMVESIISGAKTPVDAAQTASQAFERIFSQRTQQTQ